MIEPWIKHLISALLIVRPAISGSLTDAAKEPPQCKCGPGDECWPSPTAWSQFNVTVSGALIQPSPLASSCYRGSAFSEAECSRVNSLWSSQEFESSLPIGRAYPYNITCAPVDYTVGSLPTSCSLGISPRYVVNATSTSQIKAALSFARERNIRLVVASTGHDLLGRSDGWGSLEIWLRHFRNGIVYQQTYEPSPGCCASGWTGGAMQINGGYQWKDVYPVAKQHNVIIVGGGAGGPAAIGGWPAGGGHGPATRNYGLGADQTLEATVMLADGQVVIANACSHRRLLRALRGGGPGYGIVLSATVKVYPNIDVVTSHKLAIVPRQPTTTNSDLLEVVTIMLRSYADINDAGYAGYAYWFRNAPGPFIGNSTSGYSHGIWTIGKGQAEAKTIMAPVLAKLARFNGTLSVSGVYTEYKDYWSFYDAESGYNNPVGDTSILTSRFIDRDAIRDAKNVREAVEIISGTPSEFASNVVLLVSGGKVFKDAADPLSGLNPAWRTSHFAVVTSRGVPRNASNEVRKVVSDDVTNEKGVAMKKLAPNTGGYMNEGDRNDPDYVKTFYGKSYADHLETKLKYDPSDLFFCSSCVGSERFVERPDGPLCRA